VTATKADLVLDEIAIALIQGENKAVKKWDEPTALLAEVLGCKPSALKFKTVGAPQLNFKTRLAETTMSEGVEYPVLVCKNNVNSADESSIEAAKEHLKIPGREAVLVFSQCDPPQDNKVVLARLITREHSVTRARIAAHFPGAVMDTIEEPLSIRGSLKSLADAQILYEQSGAVSDRMERSERLKAAARNVKYGLDGLHLAGDPVAEPNSGHGQSSFPYIRIFNPLFSKNASTGYYISFFVKRDGLSLFASVQRPATGGNENNFKLLDRGSLNASSQQTFDDLKKSSEFGPIITEHGAGRDLDLGNAAGEVGPTAKNYDVSDVCSVRFESDDLPSDEELLLVLTGLFAITEHLNSQLQSEIVKTADHNLGLVASLIHWPVGRVAEIMESLVDVSPQVVLAGPPGTGKTYVARLVASALLGVPGEIHDSRITLVQFHPTYGYEDFVEGLRPVAKDGSVVFDTVPGPIVRLAEEIEADGAPRVLVIDEINRANIPRVFGELMYLLEYRDHSINLMLQPDFSLPPQLYIIATMNTADKSTRVMDVALRRRFDFFTLDPDVAILRGHYDGDAENQLGEELFMGFEALNARLAEDLDKHRLIGHSYFMADVFGPATLRARWDRQIAPLLDEYFYERKAQANGYRVEEFWPSVGP
jgi:hypothetical protein